MVFIPRKSSTYLERWHKIGSMEDDCIQRFSHSSLRIFIETRCTYFRRYLVIDGSISE